MQVRAAPGSTSPGGFGRQGTHKHPGFHWLPEVHWANFKAKAWTQVALFPQRPGGAATASGKQQGSEKGGGCGRGLSLLSWHTRKHNWVRTAIPRPPTQEGPALPGWLQTNSEAALEQNTHFTCTLTSHNHPMCQKLIGKTLFWDNFNLELKYEMHCRSNIPPPLSLLLPKMN